jgi:hypothetical protein
MTTAFYSGTDWQQSSGPTCPRFFELADLWPQGAGGEIDGGNKDVLAAGLHPVLAIGARANRPRNLTGVVIDYDDANRVNLSVSHCFIVRQYVANISGYNETSGAADAWVTSIDAGHPVFVDDSGPLAAGVTLSVAQTNESGSRNPQAGYVMYCQDDYDDSGFGGRDQAGGGLPHSGLSSDSTEYTLMCVLLTPEQGV